MNKKMFLAPFFLSLPLHAGTMGEPISPTCPWFASIGTGYSWTEKPGIKNPDPTFWDFANEGYDASIGDRGFYTFAVGKSIQEYIDVSVLYLNHEVFDYQKFQTGQSGGQTGFSGNARTRFFQLANRALLVNGFLHPDPYWSGFATIGITPFIGGGIGYAYNQVRHFQTVGTQVVDGTAIGSTTSIGSDTGHDSFAWQGSAGLSFRTTQSHLGVNLGYRYFDGGKFHGPSRIYANSDGFANGRSWRGHVKANQLFFEIQYMS
ncbi:outer membrane protein [Legionella sp. D16C41]|uniref:outer membrane protein n=1 Tax=Legionella sp. D16C41 TaxID=3402688 RepID=UPI003AF996B0